MNYPHKSTRILHKGDNMGKIFKNINDRVEKDALCRAIYAFLIAWEELLNEALVSYEQSSYWNDPPGDYQNHPEFIILEDRVVPYNVYMRGDTRFPSKVIFDTDPWNLDQMIDFSKRFLKDKMEFDENGNKISHTIQSKKRTGLYPIQEDIVDFFRSTGWESTIKAESTMQSHVSRRLSLLAGEREKTTEKPNKDTPSPTALIIRLNKRQWAPVGLTTQREKLKETFLSDVVPDKKRVRPTFATLSRNSIVQLNYQTVIIYFKKNQRLKTTQDNLKEYIGECFIADMFSITNDSRLVIILDGSERERKQICDNLANLIGELYYEQADPRTRD
jgi:hypothetical protein